MEESSPVKACLDTAYVQENTRPPKIAENKLQYLHSRYIWNSWSYHPSTGATDSDLTTMLRLGYTHIGISLVTGCYWVVGWSKTNLIDFFCRLLEGHDELSTQILHKLSRNPSKLVRFLRCWWMFKWENANSLKMSVTYRYDYMILPWHQKASKKKRWRCSTVNAR